MSCRIRTPFAPHCVVAIAISLVGIAQCQEMSHEQAGDLARSRASAAHDVLPNSLGRAEAIQRKDRSSSVWWYVSFEDGTFVMMHGDSRRGVWTVLSADKTLEHLESAQPFRPAYRTVDEAVSYARDVATRVGLVGAILSPTSPAYVPVPDSQGHIRKRRASVSLYAPHSSYPTLMGGNRAEVVFDTQNFALQSVMVVSGYRFEEPGGPTVGESKAAATARASGSLGEVLQIVGPGFFEMLADDTMTVEGRQYFDQYTLPLVYVVRGEQRSVLVHAVTGKVLRHRARAVAGSLPEGKNPESRTAAVGGSNLVAGSGGRRTNALHRRPGPGTVSLVLGAALAAAAVVAWSFVRTRGRLRR